MKHLYLLGAAGSIGRQTLDLVSRFPEQFKIIGLSLGSQQQINEEILKTHHAKIVCLRSSENINLYQSLYPDTTFVVGNDGLMAIAAYPDQGVFINALSGSAGLKPTIKAIESKKDILLANKETLVMAGEIVRKKIKEHQVSLYPIDSEHNALWQLIDHEDKNDIEKIIITASGGALRHLTRDQLKHIKKEDALKHPNWSMGAKITIDSATMMNKGLEVIEAHYLFDLPYDKIETLLHEESLIHGMIQLKDGSLKALLGNADMRMPILYALSYPNRAKQSLSPFELTDLHFKKMDFNRYPLLKLAYEVGIKKGLLPTVMNAANEAAVKLFLEDKISFLDIEKIVIEEVNAFQNINNPSLDDIIQCDDMIQKKVFDYKKKR
ncbi:MAG: 1-deoxy-D-xylulose-5-phosphate reductoisomerase [Acholeplasmataceae bacterium]|nr:1-deoxy-D-xylulose-5-phosphate reductoisomerase [Acholeplasmataceae bacterium]